MKVVVDRQKCTGLGICEAKAPDSFEIDDDGDLVILEEDVTDDRMAAVKEAVAQCPTAALTLVDD